MGEFLRAVSKVITLRKDKDATFQRTVRFKVRGKGRKVQAMNGFSMNCMKQSDTGNYHRCDSSTCHMDELDLNTDSAMGSKQMIAQPLL